MKKWILHIMLVGVLGMLAASCSQEADDPTQTADSRKAQVVFTIALDSPSAGSRGLWGDNYDENTNNDYESAIGTEFDNRINPAQFFVKLTLGSQTYDVQNIAYWQTSQQNVYEFVGDVNVPIGGTATYEDAKIQVYANMNPADDSFTTNYVTNPGTGVAYIPMWGVQTVDLSLTPGTRTELTEPIYLLRAMAKVEVALSAPDFTLTNVSLNKYNTTGNSLPSGAATAANTKALHYDNETGYCFNPNTTGAATNLAFNVTDNHLVFYLPEVANTADDEIMMTVTLKKGNETVQLNAPYLYFRTYNAQGSAEGATPFDVVRNHWYQYNITTVNDGIDLEFTLNVAPWTLVEKEIDYSSETISITTDDNGLGWSQIQATSTTTNKYMIAGADAVFTFRIDTPLYCEYYVDLSGEGFTITTDSEICVDETGQPNGATEVTVTIGATDDGENHEGILRIFVKEDGRYKEVPGAHRYTIIKNYE